MLVKNDSERFGAHTEQNRFFQTCNRKPVVVSLCNLLTCVVPGDRQEKPTYRKTTSFYLPTTGAGRELDKKISVVLDLH